MKKQRTAPSAVSARRYAPQDEDFEEMLQRGSVVEHLTIAAFLSRIPHKRHIDDIARFSKEVAKGADAMQAAFVTTVHPRLGILRIFPLPLLERVYEIWASQFRWPQMIDVAPPAIEDGRANDREVMKANERFAHHLRTVIAAAENTDVQHSAAVLLQWLDQQCERVRAELGEERPAEPQPN